MEANRTRSQSQIQPHRTRSGRVTTSGPARKRPRPLDSSDGDELHSLIKDLRVKRVFSQTYTPPEIPISDAKSGAGAEPESQGGDSKVAESNRTESCGDRFDSSDPDLDDSKSKEPENLVPAEEKCGGSDLDSSQKNGVELKIDSENKPMLKSRRRVFKAPGSFSYRRMLPYLKDITRDDSCMLQFCELPNHGKGLEGKSSERKLVTENQETSLKRFTAQKGSRECLTVDFDIQLQAVRGSSHVSSNADDLNSESPDNVPKSLPVVVADQCLLKPPVDGQNEITDLGVFCEAQKLNVSEHFCYSVMGDSQVNTDGVMVMRNDYNTTVENMGNAVKDDIVSSSEDQIVKDINRQSSSTEDRYSCNDNEVVQLKEDSNQPNCEALGNIEMGSSNVQSPSHINEQKVGSAEESLNQICDLNEESIQMTPPDTEILDKLEAEIKVIGREEYVHQITNQGIGKPSSGTIHKHGASPAWVDHRNECSPKRKLVLNPCSRLKLFKSPGSVSYRRLLPFLMDMEKSAVVSSHSESTVKDLEQRQPLTLSQLGSPMDKSDVLMLHTEPGAPPPHLENANGSSNIDDPNVSSEHITGSQIPSNVQKEKRGQHSASVKQCKMDSSPDIVVSLGQEAKQSVPVLGPLKTESPCGKDGARASCPELPVTSLGTLEHCLSSETALNDGGNQVEANSLVHNSSTFHATISSITQADAVGKGILKRNPRGCRGLCTCLNCASFRLHAERAFEFSRHQMQDAEEVALQLMKELSTLRKLLEKSAATANDGVVTINEVNSACRKASEAEDLARNRLGEMNYDLNIHCRITCLHEPRVRFANHNEEKVIPNAKCSSD